MQESATLLEQGEQPREDATKKEEETGKVQRKAKEEPEKMREQSTVEQDAMSGLNNQQPTTDKQQQACWMVPRGVILRLVLYGSLSV